MRILLLATWLPPAFLAAAESLIVPYAAQHHFPASSPGLMLACVPAGMIAGDFAAGRLLRPATRERLTIPLMVLAGLPLLAFAASPPLPATAGLLAAAGIGPAYLLGIQRRFLDAVPRRSSARHSGCSQQASCRPACRDRGSRGRIVTVLSERGGPVRYPRRDHPP